MMHGGIVLVLVLGLGLEHARHRLIAVARIQGFSRPWVVRVNKYINTTCSFCVCAHYTSRSLPITLIYHIARLHHASV
jgi:hypothetical protein